jgi:ABC-type antimicrobial peptide transport system permease subunit
MSKEEKDKPASIKDVFKLFLLLIILSLIGHALFYSEMEKEQNRDALVKYAWVSMLIEDDFNRGMI